MEITQEMYRTKARTNELYESYMKCCKTEIKNAIKSKDTSCLISLPIFIGFSSIEIFDIINKVCNSLHLLYNCTVKEIELDQGNNTIIIHKNNKFILNSANTSSEVNHVNIKIAWEPGVVIPKNIVEEEA